MISILERTVREAIRTLALSARTTVAACRETLPAEADGTLLSLLDELQDWTRKAARHVTETQASPRVAPPNRPSLAALLEGIEDLPSLGIEKKVEGTLEFHSSIFPLGETLQFLAFHRKTGTARIVLKSERIRLDLADGQILCAVSDNAPVGQRLAEILVADGLLEAADVAELLRQAKERGQRIGELLLERRLITEPQLLAALRRQIHHLFHRCLAAGTAEITFHAHERHGVERFARIDLSEAVLEGMTL